VLLLLLHTCLQALPWCVALAVEEAVALTAHTALFLQAAAAGGCCRKLLVLLLLGEMLCLQVLWLLLLRSRSCLQEALPACWHAALVYML
jgi:hypothetical protein